MKLITLSLTTLLTIAPSTFAQTFNFEETDDYFVDFYGSEELVEIATGIKTQIYKAPAVASVFTSQQIRDMGATDIDDVLEGVPGLHISRAANGYNPIYSFRGVHSIFNQQVLMLINNIPITNSFVGNRNQVWGGMPVEAIARIEVIRGPGSAVYGADAFSGVINIITKNADDIKRNELSIRAGSNSTQDAWATFAATNGKLKYSAVLEYHKTDGSDRTIDADLQTFLDTISGTQASLAPGELSLGTENIDFRGELNYENFTLRTGYQLRNNTGSGAGIAEALDPTSNLKSERFNIDVTYHKPLSNELTLDIQAAYFNTSQTIKNNYIIFPKNSDAGMGVIFPDGLIGNPEVWEKHERLNATFSYTGLEKQTLRFGAGVYKSDLYKTKESKNFGLGPDGKLITPGSGLKVVDDTPYIFLRETDRINRYIFAQNIWNIANDWELTAGIRHDDYSDFGHTTNPRIALVWSTSLNLSTKLLYGKAFRAPSFVDSGNINNPTTIGNPNIQPETMETTELAFDYHPGKGFGAILNFYHYEWDDIIQYVPDIGATTSTAQNFGKQTAYGSELEINWQIHEQVKLAANYAWSKATNKTNSIDVAFVPKQQWFLQIDWKINDNLKMNIKNHFVRDRLRNIGDLRQQIDDYWLTDLSIHWASPDKPYEFSLITKNLFNVDAREPSINNGVVVNIPNDLPLAGNMFLGEVRYKF